MTIPTSFDFATFQPGLIATGLPSDPPADQMLGEMAEFLQIPPLAPTHRMPDALLIGAAKSATTLLTGWMSLHPDIYMCRVEEPNFFSHPESFSGGLDRYSDLFGEALPDQIAIDSSTGYTQWPHFPYAASRIAHYVPQAKLLYLMRHPVDRAYSHYVHRWSKECHPGKPFTKTFEQWAVEDPMCVDGSNYRIQIEQYLRFYRPEDILCLFTFEVRNKPVEVLQQICRFLQIDDDPTPFRQRLERDNCAADFLESRVRIELTNRIKRIPGVNAILPHVPKSFREGIYRVLRQSVLGRTSATKFDPPPLSVETRQRLCAYFADTTRWVEEFTGRDLSRWST